MRLKRIGSIKQASFYEMLKVSLLFSLVIILIVGTLGFALSYIMIKSNEENIANVIIANVEKKELRLEDICNNLAIMMQSDLEEDEKKRLLEFKLKDEEDISGVLILNEEGKIINASNNYINLIGYDYSEKSYFKQGITSEKTIISDPFISHITQKISMSYVSPFNYEKGKALMVLFISPNFIQSSKELENVNYYITWDNGEVIFTNRGDGQVRLLDSKIVDNMRNGIFNTFIHKDREDNKYMLTTIKANKNIVNYVVVQHDIFANNDLLRGLIIVSIITIIIIIFFILIFSARNSVAITKYIDILINEIQKIEQGNYDLSILVEYPYTEVNYFMNRFYNMAKKVNTREQELLVYNEELKASNDEVTLALDTINKTEKDKQEQYLQIMHALLNLIEIKDEYTAGHSKMVTLYTTQISEKLNEEYGFAINLERLRVAAMLHDIGKIGIPGNILNKPEKLTEEEYEAIKSHSIKGYNALREVKNLKEESIVIKYHHERFDGKGYPEGLKGDGIPLGARIVCVADAFDAMTSDRPYRKGMSKDKAIEELIRNKGTQFDPFIVDVLISCVLNSKEEAAISAEK